VKLKRLDAQVTRRRNLADLYRTNLSDCKDLRLPSEPTWGQHSYHLFPIRTPRRDELISAFHANGIGYGIHYKQPIPFMDAYKDWGYKESDLPHASLAAKQLLSLPLFPELTDEEVAQVCHVIRKTLI
jgi:aminotransferase EvaB